MLTHLAINNFAIIKNLSLEWLPGMTVITGETGAGKSIILDTLELVLGKRAEKINNTEISAIFELNNTEYLLKRIFTPEGKSRCFIDNKLVTLQELKELGEQLVTLHGQHEHQALLTRDTHRQWLDNYGKHQDLLEKTKLFYENYMAIQQKINTYQNKTGQKDSRVDFLKFQVEELSQLDLNEDYINNLETEHKNLLHAKDHSEIYLFTLDILENQLLPILYKTNKLPALSHYFENASIQLEEASNEIKKLTENIDLSPERLLDLENKLNKIYDLARKYKVKPIELGNLYKNLKQELGELENLEEKLVELKKNLEKTKQEYLQWAKKLSQSREKSAKKMALDIEKFIHQLGMKGAKFNIALIETDLSAYGLEKVEFQISSNPGQPLQPLTKVASGGELSRISLAIDLIAAQNESLPTLIFDEVDVGIGGATAAIVGQLLKELSNKTQVICITHLPQVASMGNHHLHVEKKLSKNNTETTIHYLNTEEKIQEIARMLGGLKITAQTLAHARELIG